MQRVAKNVALKIYSNIFSCLKAAYTLKDTVKKIPKTWPEMSEMLLTEASEVAKRQFHVADVHCFPSGSGVDLEAPFSQVKTRLVTELVKAEILVESTYVPSIKGNFRMNVSIEVDITRGAANGTTSEQPRRLLQYCYEGMCNPLGLDRELDRATEWQCRKIRDEAFLDAVVEELRYLCNPLNL